MPGNGHRAVRPSRLWLDFQCGCARVCVPARSPSELAGFQEKTFVIDDHIGISISGLTSDARYLCKWV